MSALRGSPWSGQALIQDASAQTLQTPFTGLSVESTDVAEDDEYPNPFLPAFSRTAFLRKRLFAKQEQWSERRKIKYVRI